MGFDGGDESAEGGGVPVVELFGRGSFGGVVTRQPSRVFSRTGPSVSSHRGLGRGKAGEGCCREMRVGTWCEPVDGRDVVSHWRKAGNM